MTRHEYLLVKAVEESNELAQRITKAITFGMDEVQPGQALTNRERIVHEYTDLVATMEMAGITLQVINGRALDAKIAKVQKYMAYSVSLGLVDL